MKKLVMLSVAIAAFSLIPINQASAGHDSNRRLVGYSSCGEPIYAVYQIYGHDHCGRPLGRWVTQYPSYRRERQEYRPNYHPSSNPDYYQRCQPVRPSSNWGFSIRF